MADGDSVTIGAKADARSTATDTTAITMMQVLKEISYMEQNPASRAVTNAGTFAVQSTLSAGSALVGKVGIDQTTPGTTNAVAATNLPTTVDTNSGSKSASTVRVVIATDQPSLSNKLLVTPDLPSGASTLAEQQTQTTSLQLIDDIVYTDDTSTHSTGSSKGALFMAAATPTDSSVNANDIGAVAMTTDRKLHISVQDAIPAGTNAIGKLAANSGVDIGDVDVTSISAGSNLFGDVGIQPRTTNGLDTFMASGSDGSSILVATAQAVKASAGKVYGYYAYNPEAAVTFVHFYNTASGSVTVGTTNPLFTLPIPPASAANLMSEIGITFGTAITVAATTTAGGNTAPSTGVSLTTWYK